MPRCTRGPTVAAQHPRAGADGRPRRVPFARDGLTAAPSALLVGSVWVLRLFCYRFFLFSSLVRVVLRGPCFCSVPRRPSERGWKEKAAWLEQRVPCRGAGDGSPTGGTRVLLPSPVPWVLGTAPSPRASPRSDSPAELLPALLLPAQLSKPAGRVWGERKPLS